MNYSSPWPARVLFILGLVNMLNAVISSFMNVEKTGFLPAYINTHWITTIMIFAALAHIHLIRGDFFSEVFCFTLNIFSLAICVSAILADAANVSVLHEALNGPDLEPLRNISRIAPNSFSVRMPVESAHNAYSAIDALTSLAAIPLSLFILASLLRSSHHLSRNTTSAPVLGMGTALVVLAVFRGFLYLSEVLSLRKMPLIATSFVNYTLDEPAWIAISICTGVITVLSSKGSTLLRGVSIVSCSTLLWPAMFYMWCDYRALEAGIVKPANLKTYLVLGIISVTAELGVLVATALTLLQQFPSTTRIKLEDGVRRIFIAFTVLLLLLAVATLSLDLYTSARQIFYRVFHGNEQKLPFLAALLGLFCYLAPIQNLGAISLPTCLCVAILTASSTFFQLISYVYLTWKEYMPTQICPMLQAKGCPDPITVQGATIHFVEALMNFAVLVISTLVSFLVVRISRMRSNLLDVQLSGSERRECRSIERKILVSSWEIPKKKFFQILGVLMEVGALCLFISLLFGNYSDLIHPLLIMYGHLYHVALAVALIIFPLYQIICSEGLREQPVALSTLMAICGVRFVAILSQLDYRSTGENMDREWRIHHAVDVGAMFCCFYTIVLCCRLRNIGKSTTDRLNMEFNNPLEEDDGSREDGYIQLRPELNI